jgi:signal transduction histidine kinase/putative methionine-R-sulfoxide reductase with GAF domain
MRTSAGGRSAGSRESLDAYAERLQVAVSCPEIVRIVRDAISALPGVGQGAVYLADERGELTETARITGPESSRLVASEMQLAGVARRAARELTPVRQAGIATEALWASPLRSSRGIEGVVVAVGGAGEVSSLIAHAGLALQRERTRTETGGRTPEAGDRGADRGADPGRADLERAVEVLDTLAREGASDTLLRRVVSVISGLPEVAKSSLWMLRAEDGRYVETVIGNGSGPSLPAVAQRVEGFADWCATLPRWSGLPWISSAAAPRPEPSAGDLLLVPLPPPGPGLPVGFVVVALQTSASRRELADDLHRWTALAAQARPGAGDAEGHRRRDEELLEERARITELHRLKSQFIAAVSHELRTPLTSISAYAETLQGGATETDPETRERFLRVIQDESRRLTRIVDDILDLATMDAGRVRLSCRPIDARIVLDAALDVIRPMADARVIELRLPDDQPAEVHADPDLLKQLLVNLLENAVKFTEPDGRIEIGLERETSAVRLWVADDGPGIPNDKLDAIFERFYQVDGSNVRRHGGSGLGLAIARNIAAWHDGRIWAESGEGRGARFVVSLPRIRATSRTRASEPTVQGAAVEENRVPELVIEMIAEVMRAEAVSLMLLDDSGDELYILAAMGLPDEAIRAARVAVGESISGTVARTGDPVLVPDLNRDRRFGPSDRVRQYRTRSLISYPVVHRGETIGVLNVTNKSNGKAFSEHDLQLLAMLAERVALVISKLKELGDSKDGVRRMEEAMQGVIDVRRHYYPSEGFSALLLDLCRELGLDDERTSRIHYASILRDVGMTRLPEGVYKKPAALTELDRELIRQHPEDGARILRSIEFLPDVFDIIQAHHEEPGGTGYPRGLTEGIPLGARILGVLDAYHSLRTGRPYRVAVGPAEAIAELRRYAGGQFDPGLVDVLVRVLVDRGELDREALTTEARGAK